MFNHLKKLLIVLAALLLTTAVLPAAADDAASIQQTGTLELRVNGDDVRATFSVDADGVNYGSGVLESGRPASVPDLEAGSYVVTVTLPDGVCLTALNGYPSQQQGSAQWVATITSGKTSMYEIGLSRQAEPASLLVQVFLDDNNNGTKAKNEKLLAGAVLTLIRVENGEETIEATGTTGADGLVRLYAPEGEYTLRCELPMDYGYNMRGSKDTINNSAMEQSTERVQELTDVYLDADMEKEIGVGAIQTAVLMGTVWHDENCDGIWQENEGRVSGMRVVAEGARNGLVYETVTDEEGRFEIRQIRNGTYNVRYYVPDGMVFTYKANGAKQLRSLMTTEADRVGGDQVIFDKGQIVDEQNIGLVTEAVVEGYCFMDANYNGYLDDGEEMLAGVEVELFRQSNNKRLQTTVSDENGYFRFGNVRGDTFKLKALLPTGLTYSVNIPGDENANQFAPRDGRREQTVSNVEGECAETVSVMLGAIRYGSVSGVVYQDTDFSGSWKTGEKIVSGHSVTLLDENGATVKTVKTNKNGTYTFGELTPGQYRVKVTAAKGYAFTKPDDGNIVINLGGGQGESELFSVALGEALTGMDIGMIIPAAVSGKAFADANDNGLYDKNEKGLSGTRVSLMQDSGVVESVMVASDGSFLFDSVLPGRYYLRYELPDNGVFSPRVTGGNQVVGEGSDGAGDWFTVKSGDQWVAPVCGGLDLGTISGYAFGDVDGSGSQEAGEQFMRGMTLVLTPSRPELETRTVVTGADGAFAFDDLRPDTYTLSVRCPDGYVLSRMGGVTLGLAHGEAEQTVKLTVGMGSVWMNQALGCVMPSTYSGSAWLDENLNGLRDAGERAAAGETLVLVDQRTGETLFRLETDEQGCFKADGLAPGLYALQYALTDDVHTSGAGDTTFTEKDGALVMGDIAIFEGTDSSGALLGLVRETTIGGRVWLDSDGETLPVAGAKVTLVGGGMSVETATGKDGRYMFSELMPGSYTISVVMPAGHLALEPGDRRIAEGGLVSILAQNDGSYGVSGEIDVRMAQHQMALDIGSVLPGRLGDFCWLDLNGNGLQDGNEGGVPGVKIVLTRGGKTFGETVSDQYGYYVFEDLYPGEYVLLVTWPEEVKPTLVRTDMPLIVSVLNDSGDTLPLPVNSDGANYNGDLGFVLIDAKKYPAGYGEGAQQNWQFKR